MKTEVWVRLNEDEICDPEVLKDTLQDNAPYYLVEETGYLHPGLLPLLAAFNELGVSGGQPAVLDDLANLMVAAETPLKELLGKFLACLAMEHDENRWALPIDNPYHPEYEG